MNTTMLPPTSTMPCNMGEERFCMTPEKYTKCTRPGMASRTGTALAKTGAAISGFATSLEFLQSLKFFGPVNFIMNSILLIVIYLEYNSLNEINKKNLCPNYEKMLFKLNLMNTLVSMNMALSLLATIVSYDTTSKFGAMTFKVLSFILAIFNIIVIVISVLFHLDENVTNCNSSTWTWLLWVVAGILLVYQIYIIVMGFTVKDSIKTAAGFAAPGLMTPMGQELTGNVTSTSIYDLPLFE